MGVHDAPQWLLSAFVRSVQAVGGTAEADEIRRTGEALLARWTAPERHFHNLRHLVDVIARVDEAGAVGRDDLDRGAVLAAQSHDRALSELPVDQGECRFEGFLAVCG